MLMMLPWEAPTIFEGIPKPYFRMPRVVKDQRNKFENDDLFRQLSHESAVKYTGFKDRPLEERQMKFIANCQEGHTEVSVVQSGNQFTLMFNPTANPAYNNEGCDFDKELGKVHIKAGFILNGVCVSWRGWIDLQRLEGFGCLEFDESRAYFEDAMLKQQIDKQQATCNNGQQQQPPPPLGLLNHHHHLTSAASLAGGPPPPPPLGPSSANSMPPMGLNSCLGPAGPVGLLPGPPPPVSLADSHYGSAAIAAAAAAAFRQALSGGGPPTSQALHGLSGPPSAALAAAAAVAAAASSNGGPPPPSMLAGGPQGPPPPPSHLSYTNGHPIIPIASIAASITRTTPPAQNAGTTPTHQHNNNNNHHQQENLHSNSNHTTTTTTQATRRQATKRPQEEQTQIDDVDVVSDINAHDLDFPPRRIFKSEPLAAVGPAGGHHHKVARRAT